MWIQSIQFAGKSCPVKLQSLANTVGEKDLVSCFLAPLWAFAQRNHKALMHDAS